MNIGAVARSGRGLTGQGLRFAVVGSLATVLQLGLYAFLSGSIGAQLANISAWLISTMVATAGHQRYTFGSVIGLGVRRAPEQAGRTSGGWRTRPAGGSGESDQLVGMLTSLTGLGLSSVVLAVLDQPAGLIGTIALVAVNTVVGAMRFLALRWWLVDRGTRSLIPQVAVGSAFAGRPG